MPKAIKITKKQTSGKNTFRKCPECKEIVPCSIGNSRMLTHYPCPAGGFAPSEWPAEKERLLKEAESANSWWGKEGL